MKWVNEILCGSVAVAAISIHAISYFGGRRGDPLSIAGFPAQILPMLMSLFCLASLIVSLIMALIKRNAAGKALSFLAFSLFLFVINFAIVPASSFQAGFRQKISSSVSPGELREIARVCHETLPVPSSLPGPGKKSLWDESEHKAKWNVLMNSTSLGKLDPSLTIFNSPDSVELAWGGALVGHWGLVIQTDGKLKTGDIAEGIRTFISSD